MQQPPTSTKPVLLFDGDCGFCRRWITRWQGVTGDRMEYLPYQEAAVRFPQIPVENLARAVHLVTPDGQATTGAQAVFEALALGAGKRWPLWMYRHVPGVGRAGECTYQFVADHRRGLSRITHWLWGPHAGPPTYLLTRWVFLRLLGAIYLIAFASLGVQILGLVGNQGILPAADFLKMLRERLGDSAWWRIPTLAWISASDWSLQFLCWGGAGLSLLLIFNVAPAIVLFLLWLFYLSLYHVGQTFLGFQWDLLLLETGFLAILLAPWKLWPRLRNEPRPSHFVLLLHRWLLFRLMFLSGMVKLTADSPINQAWHKLTALTVHYQTQPLPNAIAWYMHQLPEWFHKSSCVIMFAIEIGAPFLFFFPRRIRMVACVFQLGLQILIAATGNYNFFNLLTMALCVTLLDDNALKRVLPSRRRGTAASTARSTRIGLAHRIVLYPFGMVVLLLSGVWVYETFRGFDALHPALQRTLQYSMRFGSVNTYGLFRHMTMERPEIIVEGSRDRQNWLVYEFRWKPGDPGVRPRQVAPHQPRLDWQMWFAALGNARQARNAWFMGFLKRLLEGSPEVAKLLAENPFPDEPPKWVRARLFVYEFTDWQTRHADGTWWARRELGSYTRELSLDMFRRP